MVCREMLAKGCKLNVTMKLASSQYGRATSQVHKTASMRWEYERAVQAKWEMGQLEKVTRGRAQ